MHLRLKTPLEIQLQERLDLTDCSDDMDVLSDHAAASPQIKKEEEKSLATTAHTLQSLSAQKKLTLEDVKTFMRSLLQKNGNSAELEYLLFNRDTEFLFSVTLGNPDELIRQSLKPLVVSPAVKQVLYYVFIHRANFFAIKDFLSKSDIQLFFATVLGSQKKVTSFASQTSASRNSYSFHSEVSQALNEPPVDVKKPSHPIDCIF